jgi:hypothetical protein
LEKNNKEKGRVFNVDINDKPVLTDFDIAKEAGGVNKAILKEFDNIVPDADGNISIHFQRGSIGEPKINGIVVDKM